MQTQHLRDQQRHPSVSLSLQQTVEDTCVSVWVGIKTVPQPAVGTFRHAPSHSHYMCDSGRRPGQAESKGGAKGIGHSPRHNRMYGYENAGIGFLTRRI